MKDDRLYSTVLVKHIYFILQKDDTTAPLNRLSHTCFIAIFNASSKIVLLQQEGCNTSLRSDVCF